MHLKRSLGLLDVVLFFVITGSNLQWVATAAAAGASSLSVWVIGCFAMFVPLAIAVIYLNSVYPEEGGLYVWAKHAFGPFSGFMTGWSYWTTNLPYFPALLYFMIGNALYVSPGGDALRTSASFFMLCSIGGLAIGTVLNIFGLDVEKWLNNVGAVARWTVTLLLIGVGIYAWHRFGAATPINVHTIRPTVSVKDLIFWSTIAFAWTGPESISLIAGEIKNPRRTIPLGIAIGAPLIGGIYILGTIAVLVAVNADAVNSQYGVVQAIESIASRAGWAILTPAAAVLVAISCMGSVGAWLGSVARLPFVAGIDAYLPSAFGKMHPKYDSPVVSLLTQFVLAAIVVVLGQGGTSVHGAYDVLVSMTVLVTMVPFLLIFSSAIKVRAPGIGVSIPGGHKTVVAASIVGLMTTIFAIIFSTIPAADEPNKPLAVLKIVGLTLVLLAVGAAFYGVAEWRRRREVGVSTAPL
ncbi:MAG: APC family permease [Candidatus Eremiobacteraeota bacterium]|nr:APC family permease [Candidatus Eremiobacteraeota bacterium]